MALERIVHVVPLGWERARAVRPIVEMRAHRVYLLTRTDSPENGRFLGLVRKGIAGEVPDSEVRTVPIPADREFEGVLLHTARTITVEFEAGNRVHLNMSASGKIAAAAATLAGMYHSEKVGHIYYARQEGYTVLADDPRTTFQVEGLSIGYKGTDVLPRFPLSRLRDASVRSLAYLYEKGPSSILDVMRNLRQGDLDPFGDMPSIKSTRKARGDEGEAELVAWSARFRRLVLSEVVPQFVTLGPRGPKGKKLILTRDGEFQAIISGRVSELRAVAKPAASPNGSAGPSVRPARSGR